MLFTMGNLITLGIVVLSLIFYRLADRNNRSLDKARKYADKCKEDITAFIEQKSAAIKDYGIALDVERKSAAELMRRIQILTKEELAQKVQALAQIDERIRDYDSSLEELVQMTGRVQENLNRIRDESAFVESVSKRLGETKEKIEHLETETGAADKRLASLEVRFERENADALARAMEAAVSATRSAVSELEAGAETIGRKVEEHRKAVVKIEHEREAAMARDIAHIEKTLHEAIEKAGSRADKLEEAALAKLRDQAQERVGQFKLTVEEKIKSLQETVKTRLNDIQEQLKSNKEEWKSETSLIEARQKAYSADWKKDVLEMNALAKQQQDELEASLANQQEAWNQNIKELSALAKQQQDELEASLANQQEAWNQNIKELSAFAKQQQDELEASLANQREESNQNIKELSALEQQQYGDLNTAIRQQNEETHEALKKQREEWDLMSRDAGQNIIAAFESRLEEYRRSQDEQIRQLASISNDSAQMEEELRRSMQEVIKRVNGDFVRFEEEIRGSWENASSEINAHVQTLRMELAAVDRDLTGIKERAFENVSKKLKGFEDDFLADLSKRSGEIDQHLAAWQNGLDSRLEEIAEAGAADRKKAENRLAEALRKNINAQGEQVLAQLERLKTEAAAFEHGVREDMREADASRKSFSEQLQRDLKTSEDRIRELNNSTDEAGKRSRDLIAEHDDRIAAARSAMDDIHKEIAGQSKLFDRTGALKAELERHVEDMNGNAGRLDKLKNEITQLETQFTQIKRLEDDVNAKMTRFLSEKHRIEVMENDFHRLLQTSQAVEEKLAQVSSSDDILQDIQVQIRRLEDALKETGEKYQRMERKSKTLQETTDAIDRNFRSLQENEAGLKKIDETVSRFKNEIDSIQGSIEALSSENEKARDAAEKISTLDESITFIEKRIAEMNVAREGLARLATELQTLEKEAQTQMRLTRSLLDRESGKTAGRAGKSEDRAPPPRDRDNIISLKRKGWTVEEIANAMGRSKGEIELILELSPKD